MSSYSANKKWRKANPELRNKGRQRYYAQTAQDNPRSHRPWSVNEDLIIKKMNRPSDRVLSEQIGRSVQAIQVRRSRLP